MNAKEAKEVARDYLIDLFADEEVMNIGLEEVVHHRDAQEWRITYGFVRAWDNQGQMGIKMGLPAPRSYKVVSIDDSSGKVISLKDRLMREWDD